MVNRLRIRNEILILVGVAFSIMCNVVYADDAVLDLFVGRWDVQIKTHKPEPAEITYSETYEWVLNRKFLRGHTEQKSDGSEDIIYGTYDVQAKGYPFWIFSSSGTYIYLAPASWDARTRTMEWKSPAGSDISYRTQVTFQGDNSRRWTVLIKDWKGTVLLQQEGSAIRRED